MRRHQQDRVQSPYSYRSQNLPEIGSTSRQRHHQTWRDWPWTTVPILSTSRIGDGNGLKLLEIDKHTDVKTGRLSVVEPLLERGLLNTVHFPI